MDLELPELVGVHFAAGRARMRTSFGVHDLFDLARNQGSIQAWRSGSAPHAQPRRKAWAITMTGGPGWA
jgi:hypothetical protein